MAKLAVVGQDTSKMIDCVRSLENTNCYEILTWLKQSEAIPIPVPAVNKPATFPAGTGPHLLQLSCNSPFPSLATDREWNVKEYLFKPY